MQGQRLAESGAGAVAIGTFPAAEGHSPPALRELYEIIEQRRVSVLFQPIVDLEHARVIGFEGLVRGPSDSLLHSPHRLLKVARQAGLAYEMENLCGDVVTEAFVAHTLPGALFLNVSPDILVLHEIRYSHVLGFLRRHPIEPQRVVLELREAGAGFGFQVAALEKAVARYRAVGYRVAVSALGDDEGGFANWRALGASYAKIDRHFVQNIDGDSVKRGFVRGILKNAAAQGCGIIAEGVSSPAELAVVQELGVPLGQGYHIARPTAHPSSVIPAEVLKALSHQRSRHGDGARERHSVLEQRLLVAVPPVSPETPNRVLFNRFEAEPDLQAVAVVRDERPIGLINRHALIGRLARPYHHELYDKRPCTLFMDPEPLVVDKSLSIQELSYLVAGGDRRHLSNGFIITDAGRYIGIGTGHDLIREITDLQIQAARYANPLTQLPGNVPINECIEERLAERVPFVACYCDLDHFKPFNDVYGFSKGDAIIQLTGRVLVEVCDPEQDFIGHIGGDDFIVLFRSADWRERCERVLACFGRQVEGFFSPEDRERGGYVTENRSGKKEFHPLTTLSIGAVEVAPGTFGSYMEVAHVAAESKKMAKRQPGNSLYANQRQYGTHGDAEPDHAHQP